MNNRDRKIVYSVLLFCLFLLSVGCSSEEKSSEIKPRLAAISEGLDRKQAEDFLDKKTSLNIPKGKSWLVICLDGETEIESFNVKTEGEISVKLINTDSIGRKNWNLVEANKKFSDNKPKAAYIKVLFEAKISGKVSSIDIIGKSLVKNCIKTETGIVYTGVDKRNPLWCYASRPIQKHIRILSNDILGKRKEKLSVHEKIMKLMMYVQSYRIGNSRHCSYLTKDDYLTAVISDRMGACGDYSNIVAALAAVQGIETRLITLGNYPKGDGHAVIEVKENGKWHLYDPTYAVYWTTTPENEKTPYVLSLAELRSGRCRDKDVKRIIGDESHITSIKSYDYFSPDIYEKAEPAGEFSPQVKLWYPVKVVCGDRAEFKMAKHQGGSYFGAGNSSNSFRFELRGLEVGEVYCLTLTAKGIGGHLFTPVKAWAKIENGKLLSGETKEWQNIKGDSWAIEFIPQAENMQLFLDHDAVGDKFHYVILDSCLIERIGL